LAAADGVVIVAGPSGDQGFRVEISHGADEQGQLVRTIYYHMSEALVREGQEVKRGDVIAKAGATGFVQGMHYGVAVGPRRLDHADPEGYWLGGKPQCFKPGESYPPIKTRFTYPVRC
jgi:murein DD-endopeptidase MepM/ murein hydrolase activator NlpD